MVWVNAGHEIFQEARAQTTTLLEQAISGYHEGNDVVYAMSHPEFATASANGTGIGNRTLASSGNHGNRQKGASTRRGRNQTKGGKSLDGNGWSSARIGDERGGIGSAEGGRAYEDRYIDSVLNTMGGMRSEAPYEAQGKVLRSGAVTTKSESAHAGIGAGGGGSGPDSIDGGSLSDAREDGGADQTEMGSAWDGSVGEIYGSSWENYRTSVASAAVNAAARRGHVGPDAGGSSVSDEEGQWRVGERSNLRNRGRRQGRGVGNALGGDGDGGENEEVGATGRRIMVGTVLDASHPAFERQDNVVYGFGQGSKVYPQPEQFPEVYELCCGV